MSLLTSFLHDVSNVRTHLNIFQQCYIWNFNVGLYPLNNNNNDKDDYIAKYSKYIERKYIIPLQSVIEDCYPNEIIPREIYGKIMEYQIGEIVDHYEKLFKLICKSHFCLPIILGYIQIAAIILFFVVNIFAVYKKSHTHLHCYSYIKKDNNISLLFAIFIFSFIISLLHLIGIFISYYKCNKYSKIIHKFQIELFQKHNSFFLQNDCNNILFAYISFQKWLNIKKLELTNYNFLFPHKNVPLLMLILTKYWLLTYIQFIIILSHCLVIFYSISDETITMIMLLGFIHCCLILFYCHLRVTFQRTMYQSLGYLISLLLALCAFLLMEVLIIVMLHQLLIYFNVDNHDQVQSFVNNPVLQNAHTSMDNFIFYVSNITIHSFIQYIPSMPSMPGIIISQITLLSDITDVYFEYEAYMLEQLSLFLPSLVFFLVYRFIPIISAVLLCAWFYIVEYCIFLMSLNLHNLTVNDLDDTNIANIGWQLRVDLFDLYYFMPFYRMVHLYLCFVYCLYIGSIYDLWLQEFDGFLELVLLSGILTIISIVYVYIQQQIHCLMSGLNEYQFALKYISPHSFNYLRKQFLSIIFF